MTFLVTGLQARRLLDGAYAFSARDLAIATALTAAIAIAARFIWMFPATYIPRWLFPAVRRKDPSPSWRYPFVLAYTGVRGVVSLAAALAIPFTLANGEPFPERELIQFVTFGVIIITLIGTGLTLPSVVRWLGLADAGRSEHEKEHEAELKARRQTAELARRRLEELARERQLSEGNLALIRERYETRLALLPRSHNDGIEVAKVRADLRMELIAEERVLIHQLLRRGEISDETRRRIERDLDLEEAGFRSRTGGESQGELPL
jgi:CPA1 family monovalent cation:H+ antiporter